MTQTPQTNAETKPALRMAPTRQPSPDERFTAAIKAQIGADRFELIRLTAENAALRAEVARLSAKPDDPPA